MKFFLKAMSVLVLLGLAVSAFALDVHYDYDRGANFTAYKTYQWVEQPQGAATDQLFDQNLKRAIDEQLKEKGLVRVEQNADLRVGYQFSVQKEKSVSVWGMGPRWAGGGVTQAETSTILIGQLVINLDEPARKQLVWRGELSDTINPSKDPDKDYQKLQKALTKLFKNYPPPAKAK